MKKQIFFALLALILCPYVQSASVDSVGFLSGCWRVEDNGLIITESWTKSDGKIMQGISQTRLADQTVVEYQFLRIAKRVDGHIAYTPYINGQQETDFILDTTTISNGNRFEVQFKNAQNHFPKTIMYSQSKADNLSILVRLEGLDQNKNNQVIEFPMFKVDCNTTM